MYFFNQGWALIGTINTLAQVQHWANPCGEKANAAFLQTLQQSEISQDLSVNLNYATKIDVSYGYFTFFPGEEVSIKRVKQIPDVNFEPESKETLYTFVMVAPDNPSRSDPYDR